MTEADERMWQKTAERLAPGGTPEEQDAAWSRTFGGYTFHAYVYNMGRDEFEWRGYTRESLLGELVRRVYRQKFRVLTLRYVATHGPSTPEVEAVRAAWCRWWDVHGPSVEVAQKLGLEHVQTLGGDTLQRLFSEVSPPTSAVGASVLASYRGEAQAQEPSEARREGDQRGPVKGRAPQKRGRLQPSRGGSWM